MSKVFPRRAGSPVAEPLSISDALTHLREVSDGGENDAYITGLISVARQACEDRIERSLIATPCTLRLPAFTSPVDLCTEPVIEVTGISYFDPDGMAQTINPASTHLSGALLWPLTEWPATADRPGAVTIEFSAGYGATASDVPFPLRQWMLLAIGTLYDTRHADATQPVVRHAFADHLLNPYRILGT